MELRLSGFARAGHLARIATVAAAVVCAGLSMTTVAHADNASGVQIDLGGNGGSGFIADSYYAGGSADTMRAGQPSLPNFGPTVAHPIPADLWNTSRVGQFTYSVPGLTPGVSYQARLYFLDWYFTHPGQREFDVSINGAKVLTNFDIIGAAVAKGADGQEAFGVEQDFTAIADAAGTVTIDFTRDAVDQPQVNAIALVPAGGPVQIDSGGNGGNGFTADSHYADGSVDTMPAGALTFPNFGRTVANPIDASLWDTARLGDSTYTVPGLTPGASYQARLYFLDWHYIQQGKRKFDVSINGTQVLTDFDIAYSATLKGADGPESFGVEQDFTAVADAAGSVTIAFTHGAVDQPLINAIALVPSS
jgi:hypothetical protein